MTTIMLVVGALLIGIFLLGVGGRLLDAEHLREHQERERL